MANKSRKVKKNPSPWCPKCDWYKGRTPQCPRCSFNEETGKIEVIKKEIVKEDKRVSITGIKRSQLPFLTAISCLVIVGLGAALLGYQASQPAETTTTIEREPTEPLSRIPAVDEDVVETEAEKEPQDISFNISTEMIYGNWRISAGNLSLFPGLHFMGDGEFGSDGAYEITTHPEEFVESEGIIVFEGRFIMTGDLITGEGRSTIYQRGRVFGRPASDTLNARIDTDGMTIVGIIESVSSFHSGGGENATFEFVLEKEI